jgi:hypothetical protein
MRALILVILALAPWLVTANGFDRETFRHWLDMRTGGDGEPAYWSAVGGVFSYPSGELLRTVEGVDTARTLWHDSSPDISKPGTDAAPECSWVRYGDLPPWAGGGPPGMPMVTWRIDDYDELPASLRDYLDSEAQLWQQVPADLAEIRSLQE